MLPVGVSSTECRLGVARVRIRKAFVGSKVDGLTVELVHEADPDRLVDEFAFNGDAYRLAHHSAFDPDIDLPTLSADHTLANRVILDVGDIRKGVQEVGVVNS